ncbi:hypothetical protein D3C87_2104730 [compost metagenome]
MPALSAIATALSIPMEVTEPPSVVDTGTGAFSTSHPALESTSVETFVEVGTSSQSWAG